MNLDSLSLALAQVSYSVANLTKKNFKSSAAEIAHLISQHGAEADRHLFRCLFSHVDFSGDGKSSGKDYHQTQYLIQECNSLFSKPYFVSTFCYAIDNPLHYQKTLRPSQHLLGQLSKVLRLNPVQEVVLAFALTNSSQTDTAQFAEQFARQKLPDLLKACLDSGCCTAQGGPLQDTPPETLHYLISQLAAHSRQTVKEKLGVSPDQLQSFLALLQKEFPRDRAPVLLAPVLYPDPEDLPNDKLTPSAAKLPSDTMDSSLADMVAEVGCGCTASVEECRNTLLSFGARELTAASVARVLAMIAHSGQADHAPIQVLGSGGGSSAWNDPKDKSSTDGPAAWNMDVLVQVIRDLAPHLSWKEVVKELDHPGMKIVSKAGLRVLVQALFRGLQQEMFPVEYLYQPWKNTEGQLSFIAHALKNPDVFCFADYPCHPVSIDILKTPPDEENRDIATWKSRDLTECLLRLSEAGHYAAASELFTFPVQHCPDLLLLALLQAQGSSSSGNLSTLQSELLSGLVPVFLGNHPNAALVLQAAWHASASAAVRTLVMHAMAKWYMRGEGDQSRLSRILDVAQDLKALSMLLNATPFAFVIDLACLASRREYLKLDKWLSDKVREHQEPFLADCVAFLKRRCPQLLSKDEPPPLPQPPHGKSQMLPPETIAVMLTCLKTCASNVSPALSETIMTMVSNAQVVLNKARQQQQQNAQQQGPPPIRTAAPPPPQGTLPGLPNPMDPLGLGVAAGLAPSSTSAFLAANSTPTSGFPVVPPSTTAFPGGLPQTPSSSAFSAPFQGVPPMSSGGSSLANTFPGNVPAHTATPGSPSKSFGGLGLNTQAPQGFSMQSITSQIQGMQMNNVQHGSPRHRMPYMQNPNLFNPFNPNMAAQFLQQGHPNQNMAGHYNQAMACNQNMAGQYNHNVAGQYNHNVAPPPNQNLMKQFSQNMPGQLNQTMPGPFNQNVANQHVQNMGGHYNQIATGPPNQHTLGPPHQNMVSQHNQNVPNQHQVNAPRAQNFDQSYQNSSVQYHPNAGNQPDPTMTHRFRQNFQVSNMHGGHPVLRGAGYPYAQNVQHSQNLHGNQYNAHGAGAQQTQNSNGNQYTQTRSGAQEGWSPGGHQYHYNGANGPHNPNETGRQYIQNGNGNPYIHALTNGVGIPLYPHETAGQFSENEAGSHCNVNDRIALFFRGNDLRRFSQDDLVAHYVRPNHGNQFYPNEAGSQHACAEAGNQQPLNEAQLGQDELGNQYYEEGSQHDVSGMSLLCNPNESRGQLDSSGSLPPSPLRLLMLSLAHFRPTSLELAASNQGSSVDPNVPANSWLAEPPGAWAQSISDGPAFRWSLIPEESAPPRRHSHPVALDQSFAPIPCLTMQPTMSTGVANRATPVRRGAEAFSNVSGLPPSVVGGSAPGAAGSSGVGDMSGVVPSMNQHFSKEIEDEANSYFQRIYNHPPHPTISIDEVLDMLKRFKDSTVKKEMDVFSCMLRNLFEEYRFFPQYPEKELHTTAVLFGGIIEQGLVTYMYLGIALRYVLEALRKPHGSKMYFFGIAALDRFKTRLKDYPQYCQFLATIPHFVQFPAHLKEYVEHGARSQEPPNPQPAPSFSPPLAPPAPAPPTSTAAPATTAAPTPTVTATSAPATSTPATPAATSTPATAAPSHGAIARPTNAPHRPSIANATNIDTLIAGTEGKEEVNIPPESIQDKVFFIFNNLSLANMDQKSGELKEFVSDDYLPWVAQYLVMKRASIEHNFHTLYAHFIDHLKKDEFMNMVIGETFRNIKVLLSSDKGVANFSDRSLLKNLGHWLGMLTLARNKPILQLDIDLKSLLYEAYQKGSQELLYVVPFVAKVVESCAKSKVFKPYNPWTMAIMNVLAELHQEPDLKLNLKFEIEVLCKTLSLDINDLTPSTYLKDSSRLETLECQLSASSKVKDSPSTPQPEEPLQINMPTPVVTSAASNMAAQTTPAPSTPAQAVAPPQPQFGYHEINIMSPQGLTQMVTINENLMILQTHPQLKQYIRSSVERAVHELLPPVVERSIKIALTTCEQIVKKDFALDPEESRMRGAAHQQVGFMTAGMALITGREPLLVSITNNIKNAFLTALGPGATQQQKELVEQAAQMLAQDNVELCCAYIQKTAVEKALPEMDKRLHNDYELRKHARSEGRRYCDPIVLTYQAERMPEQIRLKVGGVTHQQISVYEEFARNIPGFLPAAQESCAQTSAFPRQVPVTRKEAPPQPVPAAPATSEAFVSEDIINVYDKLIRELEAQLASIMVPGSHPQAVALQALHEAAVLARNTRGDLVPAVALLQKAVEGLLDGLSALSQDPEHIFRYRECHLMVLRALQDPRAYGPVWTNKQITRCLIECREEYRYNLDAVDCLIRSGLVSLPQYDLHLAHSMENGLNYMAVAFAMQIIQRFCIDDQTGGGSGDQAAADFLNTLEHLARISQHSRQAPEGLSGLLEAIRQQGDHNLLDRQASGPASMMQSGITQAREFDDPPGLHEKTEFLLREWVNMYHMPAAGRDSTKAFSAFVGQMHQQGILRTDDLITRFFRLCTEMCVDLCYQALADPALQQQPPPQQAAHRVRLQCFHTLDAFVRLIALLVKHSGDTANTITKINLLNKVLGIVAGVLLQDHEVRHRDFQQLSYHRIFIMLFIELNAPEHILENINFQVLTAFCNTFHVLRPYKAPGFAFAWLELVSHRVFIGRMLAITPQQRGWSLYAQLLIDLFKFLTPFLRNAELTKATHMLYKGCLRVLLVLLHDFPEFLCEYHYTFCDVIPPNCIQMRNLILSAFPRKMRLPDPFMPNLKVDMLPEISHPPRIMTNFVNMIQPVTFKKELDSYLKTRSPVTFLSDLRSKLQVSSEPGMRYNMALMNALVLHVGHQAIECIHSKGLTPSMSTIAHTSHMDIFQNLAVDLDTEGRYLFLNAISNQLRYPNSHTHYFSCTLLYLFAEANTEAIQEQITRVLLERLIVNRPHPWGLLITFIELIKNPSFKFWNHEFVHCAPEIEKLFESVARSCMQPRQAQAGMRENEGHEGVH